MIDNRGSVHNNTYYKPGAFLPETLSKIRNIAELLRKENGKTTYTFLNTNGNYIGTIMLLPGQSPIIDNMSLVQLLQLPAPSSGNFSRELTKLPERILTDNGPMMLHVRYS